MWNSLDGLKGSNSNSWSEALIAHLEFLKFTGINVFNDSIERTQVNLSDCYLKYS